MIWKVVDPIMTEATLYLLFPSWYDLKLNVTDNLLVKGFFSFSKNEKSNFKRQ